MDKIKNAWLKKRCWVTLLVGAALLSGCATARGFSYGAARGAVSTAEGVKQDTFSLVRFIQAADSWVRDNLW